MASISISDLYRGEGPGEKYGGILNAVMREVFTNGIPEGCSEQTWIELLTVKHTFLVAERMKKEGDVVSELSEAASPFCVSEKKAALCSGAHRIGRGGDGMSMLEEIWTCGLSYKDRPVKSGSALERTLCLYAKNQNKLKEMLSEEQAEQYQKTMDAFNEVVAVTEEEAFELGFTLAARLMIEVMRSAEISSIDDA